MEPGVGDIFLTSRTGESDRTEKNSISLMQMLLRTRLIQAWQISHWKVSLLCETSSQIWLWMYFSIKAGIASTSPILSCKNAIGSLNYTGHKTPRSRAQSVSLGIPWEAQSCLTFCVISKEVQSRAATRAASPKKATSRHPKMPKQMRSNSNARSSSALGLPLHCSKC